MLSRIYTRTGDDGTTGLGDFNRTAKTDVRLAAYADTDECNAAVGVAVKLGGLSDAVLAPLRQVQNDLDEAGAAIGVAVACGDLDEDVVAVLTRVQNDLFDVGADLCTPLAPSYEHPPLRVQSRWVAELEAACDTFGEQLATLRSFVLAGGTPGSAYLHVARTVVRRAERSTWAAIEAYGTGTDGGVNPLTARYLNRLSDLLFVLARHANHGRGGDVLWQPGGGREAPPTT